MTRLIGTLAIAVFALVAPMQAQDEKDIVDTAVSAGSFTTLAAALEAAELVDTLKGDGPFTVFAPTDEAFAKLPAGYCQVDKNRCGRPTRYCGRSPSWADMLGIRIGLMP